MRSIEVSEFTDTAALKPAYTLWEVAGREDSHFPTRTYKGGGRGKKLDCYVPIKCLEYYTS